VDRLIGIAGDDLVHEGEELDAPTAFAVTVDDFAGGDIERGEQGRGSVPGVVMRIQSGRTNSKAASRDADLFHRSGP
jgi:hypothetical protein